MQKFFFKCMPDHIITQVTQFIKSTQKVLNQNQNINYHQQIYLLMRIMILCEVRTS